MFEVGDLQITIIHEPLVILGDSAAHAVVGHRDQCGSGGVMSGGVGGYALPEYRAVFAVVGDGPAIPRRGRDLPGEVFERRALAFCVVCHAVSGNSIPNSIDVRLGAGFRNFIEQFPPYHISQCTRKMVLCKLQYSPTRFSRIHPICMETPQQKPRPHY